MGTVSCIVRSLLLLAAVLHAQTGSSRSCLRCNPEIIARPEDLSGLWEASDGNGGAVGLWLLLTTSVPGSSISLLHQPQTLVSLSVGIYHRKPGQLDEHDGSGAIL